MQKTFVRLILSGLLICLLGSTLAGCGTTPEPTEVPATQTPWIVVVTASPDSEGLAEARPTQTPWIIVATPTEARKAKPTATKSSPKPTGEPSPAAAETDVAPSDATSTPEDGAAAATATEAPTATATLQPTPTATLAPGEIKYQAPELLDPPSEGRVAWRSRVLLRWTSVGDLAEDEYYRIEFDRPPTTEGMVPYGDYVYSKDTEYLWERAALAPFHPPEVQGEAVVYWWVRVVRKTGEDANGKPVGVDISTASDKWTLILETKPESE
jgi:hypothetical protein